MPKSELFDARFRFHSETEKAILVSDDGNSLRAKWLPKSQIEFELVTGKPGYVDVTMPEWIAMDKGFV